MNYEEMSDLVLKIYHRVNLIEDHKMLVAELNRRLEASELSVQRQNEKLGKQKEAIRLLLNQLDEKDKFLNEQNELIGRLNIQIKNLREPSRFEESIYEEPKWKQWLQNKFKKNSNI